MICGIVFVVCGTVSVLIECRELSWIIAEDAAACHGVFLDVEELSKKLICFC